MELSSSEIGRDGGDDMILFLDGVCPSLGCVETGISSSSPSFTRGICNFSKRLKKFSSSSSTLLLVGVSQLLGESQYL